MRLSDEAWECRVKIKAGDVHFLWHRHGIAAVQTAKDTFTLFASIFDVRPFSQSAAKGLLLKLLISLLAT
jgi:hypothetical protein